MWEERTSYPIPPDLREGRYIGGYTWPELMIVGGTALAVFMLANITKSFQTLVLGAFPAAAAFLFRRQDRGFGYINPAHGIWVATRYYLTAQYGTQMFSLRRHLQLDKEDGYRL